MNTGVVFGVFDGLHEGHCAMLEQARFRVDRCIAIVPSDASVMRLKAHAPQQPWQARADALRESTLVDDVVMGDEQDGEYRVLDVIHPDVILLGYDQRALKKDLERFYTDRTSPPKLVVLDAFEPERYKSSLLNPV